MKIPSSSALWANIAPLTTSPIAKMFETLVYKWSFTITLPF
jgi:hypothetical protein